MLTGHVAKQPRYALEATPPPITLFQHHKIPHLCILTAKTEKMQIYLNATFKRDKFVQFLLQSSKIHFYDSVSIKTFIYEDVVCKY